MRDIVREKFFNASHFGSIQDADYVGEAGNKLCGDVITFYAKEADGVLKDVKFENVGCMYSFACAEQVAEDSVGRTIEEARRITSDDVSKSLGGLIDSKEHCASMAVAALRNALSEKYTDDKKSKDELKITVTDKQLKRMISETLDESVVPEAKSSGEKFILISVDAIGKQVIAEVSGSAILKLARDVVSRYGFSLAVR